MVTYGSAQIQFLGHLKRNGIQTHVKTGFINRIVNVYLFIQNFEGAGVNKVALLCPRKLYQTLRLKLRADLNMASAVLPLKGDLIIIGMPMTTVYPCCSVKSKSLCTGTHLQSPAPFIRVGMDKKTTLC